MPHLIEACACGLDRGPKILCTLIYLEPLITKYDAVWLCGRVCCPSCNLMTCMLSCSALVDKTFDILLCFTLIISRLYAIAKYLLKNKSRIFWERKTSRKPSPWWRSLSMKVKCPMKCYPLFMPKWVSSCFLTCILRRQWITFSSQRQCSHLKCFLL